MRVAEWRSDEVTEKWRSGEVAKCNTGQVSVIIPTLDEAATVGSVVRNVATLCPGAEVIVVDNGSRDYSSLRAMEEGARVVSEPRQGKGWAMRCGAAAAQGEILVFLDGDGSYPVEAIDHLVQPILAGRADLCYGRRIWPASGRRSLRYLGNRWFTWLARRLHGPTQDVLTGMYAIRREVFERLAPQVRGFEVEAALFTAACRERLRRLEVPIAYRPRRGQSKLRPWRDGWRILQTLLIGVC